MYRKAALLLLVALSTFGCATPKDEEKGFGPIIYSSGDPPPGQKPPSAEDNRGYVLIIPDGETWMGQHPPPIPKRDTFNEVRTICHEGKQIVAVRLGFHAGVLWDIDEKTRLPKTCTSPPSKQ